MICVGRDLWMSLLLQMGHLLCPLCSWRPPRTEIACGFIFFMTCRFWQAALKPPSHLIPFPQQQVLQPLTVLLTAPAFTLVYWCPCCIGRFQTGSSYPRSSLMRADGDNPRCCCQTMVLAHVCLGGKDPRAFHTEPSPARRFLFGTTARRLSHF